MFNDHCFKLRILSLISAAALSLQLMSAQPKSIGAMFSFTGTAFTYEHSVRDSGSFIECSLKAETTEYYLYRASKPGISASITWNTPFRQWQFDSNKVCLVAGYGIAGGYCKDFKQSEGVFFGLKGRIGFEFESCRNIKISTFLSPIIGANIESGKEYLTMKSYANGIIYCLMPEFGIKYRF